MKLETRNLAVKYRPRVLEDYVGQDHVVDELKGMFKRGRMPSSILLAGPTGTGKTTLARIIARYINCSHPDEETHAPCGECANCKMVEHPDVMELNAADTRGIDDVRNLLTISKNSPIMGEKKIIVLDEAQALTPAAQSCLLKGLEEPSASTIWIISSMNAEKLLPAIAGRCSKMVLKTVPPEAMSSRLRRISRKEGLDFKKLKDGDKVMKILCDLSCGHMRNAIELLDKAISYSRVTDKVSTEALMELYLQSPEAQHEETAAVILAAILEGNQKAMLTAFYKSTVYRELLYKMRFLSDCILQVAAGTARFTPSIMRIFKSKYSGRISLSRMLQVQMMLAELEFRMNSISIDERILMTAFIGDFIATHTTKD